MQPAGATRLSRCRGSCCCCWLVGAGSGASGGGCSTRVAWLCCCRLASLHVTLLAAQASAGRPHHTCRCCTASGSCKSGDCRWHLCPSGCGRTRTASCCCCRCAPLLLPVLQLLRRPFIFESRGTPTQQRLPVVLMCCCSRRGNCCRHISPWHRCCSHVRLQHSGCCHAGQPRKGWHLWPHVAADHARLLAVCCCRGVNSHACCSCVEAVCVAAAASGQVTGSPAVAQCPEVAHERTVHGIHCRTPAQIGSDCQHKQAAGRLYGQAKEGAAPLAYACRCITAALCDRSPVLTLR